MTEKFVTVSVQPTTGGKIEVHLPPDTSVSNLKIVVARRLKVSKDKIILLHRNKQLLEGTLKGNNIVEGSKLTLLPNVETGIMSQNPEQCVMQALETLNDSQVDNFLAGRSPLHLTMRFGDHMMFIQLQLSTITKNPSSNNTSTTTTTLPTPPTTPTTTSPDLPFPTVGTTATVPQSLPSPPPSPKLPTAPSGGVPPTDGGTPKSDVFTEASRSLTKTLQQLSSSALTKKMTENCDGRCCITRRQGGAIIESMYHHGRGIFSGTFTGTLSPSLQDQNGRPRRNICTIIHILNDLLGASSHCNPSAQCFCLPGLNATLKAKMQSLAANQKVKVADETEKQNENKVLREKVEHIQTMLKERRMNRGTPKRNATRFVPYPRTKTDSTTVEKTSEVEANVVSSLNPEDCQQNDEQTLMDYSSETAVA